MRILSYAGCTCPALIASAINMHLQTFTIAQKYFTDQDLFSKKAKTTRMNKTDLQKPFYLFLCHNHLIHQTYLFAFDLLLTTNYFTKRCQPFLTMLLKNSMESLDETPLKVQGVFTEISEIQQQNAKHEELVLSFLHSTKQNTEVNLDQENDEVNQAFMKLYESDKAVISKYDDLLNFLDGQIDIFQNELEDFRENCAISALKLRAIGTEIAFDDADTNEKFCYCRKKSNGHMIACDGDSCPIEWFHYDCVGLSEQPKGKWMCDECKNK